MWSDPDDVEHWSISPRGAGWLFGNKVTKEVATFHLDCDSLKRSKFMFPDNDLVTVWSAPNYCYRCGSSTFHNFCQFAYFDKGNVASVLKVKENEPVTENNFAIFDAGLFLLIPLSFVEYLHSGRSG
ncbi:hypothetical protein E3P92_01180 [Wallemia ichthyophaga]|nr:hypothetical protein E3P91_00887 [Wallemia ichthyophaga]TIB17152.1 hypothetical protein E3P92_01180 [Wallemia ichthyophaga]TIB64743.1 hypothetical protein E3P78_00954 [Wallemia ichthyophaga]TIB68081.1 hypothetical protein E3P77_01263 [Wallemia ichthyophaga]